MSKTKPQDPDYESRVRASFERQQVMHTMGARLTLVEPGRVEIELPFRADLTQQHGFIHAGVTTTLLDTACGYAAYTLMPPDAAVLSIEFKVNLLAPAKGELVRVRAEVKRAGRNVTVCTADAFAIDGRQSKVVATMLGTMMTIRGRDDMTG